MKAAGKSRFAVAGRLISLVIIVFATAIALYTLHESDVYPTTSDSSIDADVVHIAAAENARVAKGDLLFKIDPVPYQLTTAQTEADLHLAEAQLETQKRLVST